MSYTTARAAFIQAGIPVSRFDGLGLASTFFNVIRGGWQMESRYIRPDGVGDYVQGEWAYRLNEIAAAYSIYSAGVGSGHCIVAFLQTMPTTPSMGSAADGVPDITINMPGYPGLLSSEADVAIATDNGSLVEYRLRWNFPEEDVPRGVWAHSAQYAAVDIQVVVDDGMGAAPEFDPIEVCSSFWVNLQNAVAERSCVEEAPPAGADFILSGTGNGDNVYFFREKLGLPGGLGANGCGWTVDGHPIGDITPDAVTVNEAPLRGYYVEWIPNLGSWYLVVFLFGDLPQDHFTSVIDTDIGTLHTANATYHEFFGGPPFAGCTWWAWELGFTDYWANYPDSPLPNWVIGGPVNVELV